MGTAAKTSSSSPPIEEFLGYDSQGHSVVLRRSTEHPGMDEAPAPSFRAPTQTKPAPASVKGTFGFFADLQEVRARLRGKLQHS